jgi:hypothetical protein
MSASMRSCCSARISTDTGAAGVGGLVVPGPLHFLSVEVAADPIHAGEFPVVIRDRCALTGVVPSGVVLPDLVIGLAEWLPCHAPCHVSSQAVEGSPVGLFVHTTATRVGVTAEKVMLERVANNRAVAPDASPRGYGDSWQRKVDAA